MITNKQDYYNRPSLHTSASIAITCVICLGIMMIGLVIWELVSEKYNDFDDTLIEQIRDTPAETVYLMETKAIEGLFT